MRTLGKPLIPELGGKVILDAPKWELSQRAKDEIEAIRRNQIRAAAMARFIIFD